MKKIIALVLSIALVFMLTAPIFAASDTTVYLKGDGKKFDEKWSPIIYLGSTSSESVEYQIWHLVYSGDLVTKKTTILSGEVKSMNLKFIDGVGNEVFWSWSDNNFIVSFNNGGNNAGWVFVAPIDWKLDSSSGKLDSKDSYLITTNSKAQFNISGYNKFALPENIIEKEWTDGNPKGIEASFDVYKDTGIITDNPLERRGEKIEKVIPAGEKFKLDPGKYVIAEQSINGYVTQPDQYVTIKVNDKDNKYKFINEPEKKPEKASLNFEKKVEGINLINWLHDKFNIDAKSENPILKGLNFYLKGDNGEYGPENPDDKGKVGFNDIKPGVYILSEVITGDAKGMFKQMADIEIIIAEGENRIFVLDGAIKGNIEGVKFDKDSKFTIVNGWGTGTSLNYKDEEHPLTNGGDLFYIGVTDVYTSIEYASFCAHGGSERFAGPDQSNLGCSGYMVVQRAGMDDLQNPEMANTYDQILAALNWIQNNSGDLRLGHEANNTYTTSQRKVAQTVIWALLGNIDVTSTAFSTVNLTDEELFSVAGALDAAKTGYIGEIVDLVYMVCDEHHDFAKCQPQLVPIYGTFYVENKPEDGGKKETDIFLKKYVKQGEIIIEWNDEHPFWFDNQFIFFDLFNSNETGDNLGQALIAGQPVSAQIAYNELKEAWGVEFVNLTVGNWYLIKERIDLDAAKSYDDYNRLSNYIQPLPSVHFLAVEDVSDLEIDFNPGNTTETGIKTLRNVIISTDLDNDLSSESGNLVALDDTVMWDYNGETPIVPFWKNYMIDYNGGDNFFTTLDHIWLDDLGEIRPQFIWNTDDFTNKILAHDGDVEIFTKTFTILDTLTDSSYDALNTDAEIPFYITGDNAFIVFVNGIFIGKSDAILYNDEINLENYERDVIGDLREGYLYAIPMDTWAKVYVFDIKDALIPGGENEIKIVTINAGDTYINADDYGSQNYKNRPMSNPAGFIFGCEIFSISEKYRFVNELPIEKEPVGAINVTANVEMYNIQRNFKPVYGYDKLRVNENTIVSEPDGTGEIGNSNQTYIQVGDDGARIELVYGAKYVGTGVYYNVDINDDDIILTFDKIIKADVGVIAFGSLEEAPKTPGHPNSYKLTEKNNTITISKPDNGDVIYLFVHIAGGIDYYGNDLKFQGWEYCCENKITCDICAIPTMTARIYDNDGELIAESDLRYDEFFVLTSLFQDLKPDVYAVRIYNGNELIDEEEATVIEDDITEVSFQKISLRCNCDVVINENLNHK